MSERSPQLLVRGPKTRRTRASTTRHPHTEVIVGKFEDLAAFEGSEDERLALFHRTYSELERRIELFTDIPIESLDRLSLKTRLDEIGKIGTPAGKEN